MQKKLYFLNEEEKNRILNLHESRTKKQYLLEEDLLGFKKSFEDIEKLSKSIPKGFLNSEMLRPFKDIKPQFDLATPIAKACKTLQNLDSLIVDTPEQIESLVEEIEKRYYASGHVIYLNKQDALEMGDILKKFKSIPDLCYGIKISPNVLDSETTLGQFDFETINDNFLKLFWDIFHKAANLFVGYPTDTLTVKQAVYKPFQEIIKKSETGVSKQEKVTDEKKEKTTETLTGWENYPCVTDNPNAKKIPLKDGTVAYDLIGLFFYGNGRKMDQETKKMSSYHCASDNTIVEGPKTKDEEKASPKVPSPVTGVGRVTKSVQEKVPEVLAKAGLEKTDITQDSVNKLFDILSKKS